MNQRDVRLDFFRGVAMLIIYVAHVPGNWFGRYIPARFGFSDAAEMFVFLSGFAAAIAFGGSFRRSGFWLGTARIAYRCWQLYISHLMLFFAIAAICVIGNFWLDGRDYIGRLNLYRFFEHTESALVGLFTLTYVPNFFDIIPMYIGALALVPVLMALARFHPWLALGFSLGLYLAMWPLELEFVADTRTGRPWFFNPFGWQLLFFTGYALSSGWVKPPPAGTCRWLLWLCVAYVLLSVPLSHHPIYSQFDWLKDIRETIKPLRSKTNFGVLRWLHFLALAYITVTLLKGREHWLAGSWAKPIVKTGQNALPVFLLSMMLAVIGGMFIDQAGRNWPAMLVVNFSGFAILIGAAYMFGWFRSTPWRRQPTPPAADRPAAPDPAPGVAAAGYSRGIT